jgi:hypothetical protein
MHAKTQNQKKKENERKGMHRPSTPCQTDEAKVEELPEQGLHPMYLVHFF